ncbi:protoporphyrinogen oxidase [Cesiribacter andamanensis]|uniref:Protoporphyrinogen oxidase n=1 Tax=Cesiribacter andamanensis AMV16 TaxID=1279009 RepID=M7NVT4_9BACT|nr:protoporphyrinogen oxidase [Cesiribacter andamanensis]EMR02584.1 protoporphyrinogen oxidase [Cesiribacter andamanensis AMV16]
MTTAILYTSSQGTTEKVAHLLAKKLAPLQPLVLDLRTNPSPDLTQFDLILIGGSIHIGQMNRRVRHLCHDHLQELLQKKIGLFMCCLERSLAKEQFERAFPAELIAHSQATACVGGELIPRRMSLWQKLLLKVRGEKLVFRSELDHAAINGFAESMLQANTQQQTLHPLKQGI